MKNRKLLRLGSAATLSLVLALSHAPGFSQDVQAHEVSPIRTILLVGQGQTSTSLSVRNTRDKDLPIEVVALRRDVAPDGTETLTPAEDAFRVFPPQFLLKPGDSQTLRIEYTGDRTIDQTVSYVIDVREIPVIPDGYTGVMTAYNFGAAVYVTPSNARPDLRVRNIAMQDGRLNFQVENRGRDYAVLTLNRVLMDYPTGTVEVAPSDFVDRLGNPMVPPRSVRTFTYTPPEGQTEPVQLPTAIRIEDLS